MEKGEDLINYLDSSKIERKKHVELAKRYLNFTIKEDKLEKLPFLYSPKQNHSHLHNYSASERPKRRHFNFPSIRKKSPDCMILCFGNLNSFSSNQKSVVKEESPSQLRFYNHPSSRRVDSNADL
ncbi:unnamed protein product [Blepharisma stoltei]|uniref:Uncharacterized protein n=1 Tax=Blepharisma stoltei TaxID=1481888 RepID=A0AAU9K0M8_9CILI|nr:unnamed protein product [Blepharisma stoltei]